ncbi:hypothetical protein A2291_01600 [candidate division WOR-1 bacterium RIFOXYB2_FULL_42_35]|nr:MAG: hypothetical protein A2291_01600 [candidate division WOR-1 bacterium RIFOXYB2_FULL_42_35]OGC41865.1 MAG: hypothetical protein A2548_03685 [candidate division WOR-1 bacterium RIFOXYD2_FULL_41_8]
MIIFFALMAIAAAVMLNVLHNLPNINSLSSYIPSETTLIFSSDGQVLARLHQEENRRVVPLSQISPYLQKIVIAVEDPRFYQHHGLDFIGIVRAGLKNIVYGRVKEGASTITQQLARALFLNRKKVISRKLAEAILAVQLERRYTKDEILELYLNNIYMGHNAYGIESAANLYFNKKAADLDIAESAMIVGLIKGPELYSPYRNFKGAKTNQIYALNKALEQNFIFERDAKLAAIEELKFSPQNLRRYGEAAPYFISYVLKQLIDLYGKEQVYHGGLRVYTTLDSNMQAAAESVVTSFASKEGEKFNFSQAALLSIDPRTGYIKAMVGGVDFYTSKFNRTTQSKRSPGSAFKPFTYTAAMEQGISPGTILQDTSTTFEVYPNEWNPSGTWAPNNYDEKFRGAVTLRYALEKSLNIPAIKISERVGLRSIINVARRMGIISHLEPGLALTLGASEVTMLELTSAYGTFANSGIHVEPASIIKIEDPNGVVLYKNTIKESQALDPNIAAVMVDLLKGVILRGTGIRGQIYRPAAAKTGTAQEFRDAWFVGFVPQLVTGVWVGNDDNASMKGVAEVAVCPRIWKEYNLRALANLPKLDFPRPEGLVEATICIKSGKIARPYCPKEDQRTEKFWLKDLPKEKCNIHKSAEELYQQEVKKNEVTEVWN